MARNVDNKNNVKTGKMAANKRKQTLGQTVCLL